MPEEVETMTRKRLEKLRARVFTDYQQWDVKCSKDGFQEASPTGEMDSDGNDLLALIDAEIARQSVTDEQIRTALDYVNDYKKEAMAYDTSVGIFPPTSEEVRAWETVETALRQHQKPTDEAVQRAIEDLLSGVECTDELTDEEYIEAHLSPQGHELAIQALRQMRTEPCWYCKGIESHSIKSVKTVTDESNRGLGAYDTPYNFCPNCGRKLPEPPKSEVRATPVSGDSPIAVRCQACGCPVVLHRLFEDGVLAGEHIDCACGYVYGWGKEG